MANRFNAYPEYLVRALRFVLVGAVLLVSTLIPALPVSADNPFAARSVRAQLFHVDIPAPGTMVSNGVMLDIGGWTTGSRVDVYLDGAAGVGQGVGSAEVIGARPDVAGAIGADLAYSGFDVPWLPLNLSTGAHTLYLYSFIEGAWTFQTLSIIGEGNVLPVERDTGSGNDDGVAVSTGSDAAVDSAPGPGVEGPPAL